MKNFLIFTSIAPIALVAACAGDNENVTEDSEMVETGADYGTQDAATGSDNDDGPAQKISDAGDLSGEYTYASSDGKSSKMTLSASDTTYTFTDSSGVTRTGPYIILDDGYRFRIDDFDGGPGSFAVRNGRIYRLNNDAEFNAETNLSSQDGDSDSDSGYEERAVFSREPTPASPVVPQD